MVGILGGTVAVWTPLLSAAFLREGEVIDRRLVVNIAIVVAGVVPIALV